MTRNHYTGPIVGKTPSAVLPDVLWALMNYGRDIPSRNGATRELQNATIHVETSHHPYITTPGRKASLPAQIAETMWILAGRNDVEWLSHYLPRAKDFSDDGATWRGGYGPRIRRWSTDSRMHGHESSEETVDQLEDVVNLLRKDPDTRRAVIQIYDPATDTVEGKDIPCNNWLHFMVRDGAVHLHVATRSNDAMWGWSGINSFEWSVLLQVVAALSGHEPGSITYSISSLHLYQHHFKKANAIIKENDDQRQALNRPIYSTAPLLELRPGAPTLKDFDRLVEHWFGVEAAIRRGDHAYVDEKIREFPEPMMRSWLQVLQAWWTGDNEALYDEYQGTELWAAYKASPENKAVAARREAVVSAAIGTDPTIQMSEFVRGTVGTFLADVRKLHAEKNAAYGDSWKRRGEMMAIMANIARKVDRLGKTDNHETAADTAIDLLVYLVKYRLWLVDHAGAPVPHGVVDDKDHDLSSSVRTKYVDQMLTPMVLENGQYRTHSNPELESSLRKSFDLLTTEVETDSPDRYATVDNMIKRAYRLAIRMYHLNTKEK